MDDQKAANEINVNFILNGEPMKTLLTLEWRVMRLVGLLWVLLLWLELVQG